MTSFAKVYNSNWKKFWSIKILLKVSLGLRIFLLMLALSISGMTLHKWSDHSLSRLVIEIELSIIKGQTLKICHKENRLYVNGKYFLLSSKKIFRNFYYVLAWLPLRPSLAFKFS